MPALEVIRPGILTTVQDLGRPGLGRFGVSPGGAMDPLALRVANRLAGNPDGAPALELTGPGVELRFLDEVVFALAGADLGAQCAGRPLAPWRAHRAAAGDLLRLPRRIAGARAVLAVAGGLDQPAMLGSASADLDAGLGGGRVGAGKVLSVGGVLGPRSSVLGSEGEVRAEFRFAYEDPFRLRFVPAEDEAIAADLRARFVAEVYRVSERSNRTGFRLTGAALPATAADRLSAPIAPGTIQLPPDGQPILLMADRGTIGGYPCLGHVIAADRPKSAQLWPGDQVRFVAVTLDEAHRAARALAAALEVL